MTTIPPKIPVSNEQVRKFWSSSSVETIDPAKGEPITIAKFLFTLLVDNRINPQSVSNIDYFSGLSLQRIALL